MASNTLVAGHLLSFIVGRDPECGTVLTFASRRFPKNLRARLLK